MVKESMQTEEDYMRRCIELATQSQQDGDLPFGAVLSCHNFGDFEAKNTGLKDITGHAEINAIKQALVSGLKIDFKDCTLYTNFEPCAMCSFVIRDVGIGRVVFAVESPHLGGYSKWDILSNNKLRPEFTSKHQASVPRVIGGVLKTQVQEIFDRLNWKMHKPHDFS